MQVTLKPSVVMLVKIVLNLYLLTVCGNGEYGFYF